MEPLAFSAAAKLLHVVNKSSLTLDIYYLTRGGLKEQLSAEHLRIIKESIGWAEDAGLIERRTAGCDKRQSLILLTEKSRNLQGKYDEVSRKMNEIFYQGFTEEEVRETDQRLDRILLNLEQSQHKPKKEKE